MLSKLASIFLKSCIASIILVNSALAQTKEYKLAVEDVNYPPYHSFKSGQLVGITRDIFDAFSQDTGINIKYVPIPVIRGVVMLKMGDVDFKYPDNSTWDADTKQGSEFLYSEAVIEYTEGFLTKKDKLSMSLDQMKSFSTVIGFVGWDDKEDQRLKKGQIKKQETRDFDASLQQLISGRTDAVFGTITAVMYVAKANKMDDKIEWNKNIPFHQGQFFMSTIKHKDVLDKFNEWQKKHADRIKAMIKKHDVTSSR